MKNILVGAKAAWLIQGHGHYRSLRGNWYQNWCRLLLLHWQITVCILFAIMLVGCGAAENHSQGFTEFPSTQEVGNSTAGFDSTATFSQKSSAPVGQSLAKGNDASTVAAQRKIIYTTNLELIVKDLLETSAGLKNLVQQYGGYLSSEQTNLHDLRIPTGTWVVRIPVQNHSDFLTSAGCLGRLNNQKSTTKEVTDEYVDLQARIANAKKLEERIIKLLERTEDRLAQVIEVENELARVRETIERMEGRLRQLANLTSLTTITISARQETDYVPATIPTFIQKIGMRWEYSIATLSELGQTFVLIVVGVFPFVVVAAMLTPLLWVGYRIRQRISSPDRFESTRATG